MKSYYEFNHQNLLNIKPNIFLSIQTLLISFILIITIFSFNYEVKKIYATKIYVSCQNNNCQYYLYCDSSVTQQVLKTNTLIIQNKNYPYKVISLGELQQNEHNQNNYQLIAIKLSLAAKYQKNNLLINTNIILSKEKLITKIKNTIF